MDVLNEMHPTLENTYICCSKLRNLAIIAERGESTMQNIRIYITITVLGCSGGNSLGAYDLGTTRFGSDKPFTVWKKYLGPLTVPVV